jgi:SAM-dependent methyltransferase
MSSTPEYVLGSDPAEIARLDAQAAAIAPATDVLLRAAGLRSGMRVLDLGTGLGHVAFQVAALVGSSGAVVGVDQAAAMLEVAEGRRAETGLHNMRFVRGDVRSFRDEKPFDAIVERLVLFHLPDAVDVVRHHLEGLRPGGTFVAVDFDIGASRSEPAIELVTTALGWIEDAFRSAGANPRIGAQLGPLLRAAGLDEVTTLGVQAYAPSDAPTGPRLLAGTVRTLAPQLVAAGLATEAELGLDTLEQRIAEAVVQAEAVVILPTVAGAWGRRALDV